MPSQVWEFHIKLGETILHWAIMWKQIEYGVNDDNISDEIRPLQC